MVEHQTCVSLVNASTLCAIEQQVKGENNADAVVAEISAELEIERQKNAELIERISVLESQIKERDMETQKNHQHAAAAGVNNFKRQKIELVDNEIENNNIVKTEHKPDTEAGNIVPNEINPPKSLINWMRSMDDDSQNMDSEKLKDSDSAADFNETDSDENYVHDINNGQRHDGIDNNTIETASVQNGYLADHFDDESNVTRMESCSGHENEQKSSMLHTPLSEKVEVKETTEAYIAALDVEVPSSGYVRVSSQNSKPRKVAFCPKEVKKIIECEGLVEKNAQSHTIRKIIVFASLGIRHGCEDMYELDLNHFSILNKGEPYVSPKNPGEHVLYENPGVRRKIFYPNRQNTALCPVQILEEERTMRPCDASCPSCLFLCIKYGGRTRNLPQNEYVRQRMGRNKLKSFGPIMCRMALLVHICTGSFFFKALGITLLFMAGFPDDLVQRETKYRNLDLLQKYYRTDKDAEGEELFLPHPIAVNNDNGSDEHHISTKKTLATKSRGRKQASSSSNINSHNLQKTSAMSSVSGANQFGLTGYSSSHTNAMASFHSMPSHPISQDTSSHMPNPSLADNHSSYHMLPPLQTQQLASSFVPVMYWPPLPPPTAFLPSTFGYQSFPSTANYMSFQTRPYYYNHPIPTSNFSLSKLLEDSRKNDSASDEAKSDCHSSSGGSTKHKSKGPSSTNK